MLLKQFEFGHLFFAPYMLRVMLAKLLVLNGQVQQVRRLCEEHVQTAEHDEHNLGEAANPCNHLRPRLYFSNVRLAIRPDLDRVHAQKVAFFRIISKLVVVLEVDDDARRHDSYEVASLRAAQLENVEWIVLHFDIIQAIV